MHSLYYTQYLSLLRIYTRQTKVNWKKEKKETKKI